MTAYLICVILPAAIMAAGLMIWEVL